MGSVNKVILVGNLGADPELKYTPANKPVCNLRLATNEVFKDRQGNRQERTEWHRVTVWGDMAENCDKYLEKGRSVYIEGKLQTRSWDDRDGVKRYSTEVVAERVVFLPGGGGGGGGRRDGGHGDEKDTYSSRNNYGRGRSSSRGESSAGPSDEGPGPGPPPGDDDIPF